MKDSASSGSTLRTVRQKSVMFRTISLRTSSEIFTGC